MQYILTEEEYKNLVPGNKVAELEADRNEREPTLKPLIAAQIVSV